jgi:hypothetical protein
VSGEHAASVFRVQESSILKIDVEGSSVEFSTLTEAANLSQKTVTFTVMAARTSNFRIKLICVRNKWTSKPSEQSFPRRTQTRYQMTVPHKYKLHHDNKFNRKIFCDTHTLGMAAFGADVPKLWTTDHLLREFS